MKALAPQHVMVLHCAYVRWFTISHVQLSETGENRSPTIESLVCLYVNRIFSNFLQFCRHKEARKSSVAIPLRGSTHRPNTEIIITNNIARQYQPHSIPCFSLLIIRDLLIMLDQRERRWGCSFWTSPSTGPSYPVL